ncbi:MAG: hypothetical protein ABEK02_07045, partial [Haloquadratum sp.]
MTDDVPPPELDVPDEWRRVSAEVTTPFEMRLVTVTAHTHVYEDVALRDRLAEATGTEATWRFVFASRLHVRPRPPSSTALTRLVADRAAGRFVETLDDRGFSEVARAGTRRIDLGGGDRDRREVRATRYRAQVSVGDRDLPVEAYFAAWRAGDGHLLGGGAYPLSLPLPLPPRDQVCDPDECDPDE